MPSPSKSLVISRQDHQVLSKEQKRFNSIVKRIKKVRAEMAQTKAARDELEIKHRPRMVEAEKASTAGRRSLVLSAHASPGRKRLSKQEAKKFAQIMQNEIAGLLGTILYRDDEQLKSLFQIYDPRKASYDDVLKQQMDESKRVAADMMRDVFGMDMAPDDLDDDARMQEHFRQLKQEMEEQAASTKPRKKQGKKQLAAEAAREQAETALHKTTRQIYLDLVKHYHPDREQDETARAEKTEWMKQITAAYEADDHLRLLELQMTLLTGRDNAYAGFDDAHLKVFNQTLQRQLRELEAELHFSLGSGPLDQFMHRDPRVMRLRVDAYILDMEEDARDATRLAADLMEHEHALRHWIRNYSFDDEMEFEEGFAPFGVPF